MGLRTNKWTIAYRKKQGQLLDDLNGFIAIKAKYKGCYADPFLFDYQGETYLFAEYLNYRHGRGTIAYAKYDKVTNTFSDFKEIIFENYHLSYPLVFSFNDEIYMMPEANESNSLYIYKAIDFPDKWEKYAIVAENVRLVDTSPFWHDNELFLLSKENETPQAPMVLLKVDTNNWSVANKKVITDDVCISRPGGNAFLIDNRFYIPTQDCKDDYGAALNFLSFTVNSNLEFNYTVEKKITPDMLSISGIEKIVGIHTYNYSNDLEVIDFKYPVNSFSRLFWKLIRVTKQKLHLSK